MNVINKWNETVCKTKVQPKNFIYKSSLLPLILIRICEHQNDLIWSHIYIIALHALCPRIIWSVISYYNIYNAQHLNIYYWGFV